MRIAFMGTPSFSAEILKGLIENNFNIVVVVTKEDKIRDRSRKKLFSPVMEVALKNEIPVLQPQKLKNNEEFYKELKEFDVDVILTAAYGKILPSEILSLAKKVPLNVHASLLPKYRGAAPIQYALLNGEEYTGISLMIMNEGMDTGDVLKVKKLKIEDSDNVDTLFEKLSKLSVELLKEGLPVLDALLENRIPQDEEKATYTKMITKEMGILDFNRSARELFNQIRAFSSYTYLDGKMLKITKSDIGASIDGYKNGTIVETGKNGITVVCSEGSLIIKQLKLEGKKELAAVDFINGHKGLLWKILGEVK